MIEKTLPDSPVFIRGISRSGGTLTNTIVDASEEVAMSYEVYPDLLIAGNKSPSSAEFGDSNRDYESVSSTFIQELSGHGRDTVLHVLKQIGAKSLTQFILRAERSGLSVDEIAHSFGSAKNDGPWKSGDDFRLEVVAQVCRKKMVSSGKMRWGAKCSGNFDMYRNKWPQAAFVNVIRDPRDILASQLKTGNFRPDIAQLAKSWRTTHARFRGMVESGELHGFELSYEALCLSPLATVTNLYRDLGLAFSPEVLNFGSKALSIHRTPNGHLSRDRISQPIDPTMIGRWRRDLSAEQLKILLQELGDSLYEFVSEEYL